MLDKYLVDKNHYSEQRRKRISRAMELFTELLHPFTVLSLALPNLVPTVCSSSGIPVRYFSFCFPLIGYFSYPLRHIAFVEDP
jgi:hypothetical protein